MLNSKKWKMLILARVAVWFQVQLKLKQLQSLSTNQKVNVEGILLLGPENPKEVNMRDGQIGLVKEDCAIEDETGTAILYSTECHQGMQRWCSIQISNVSVKNCSGEIFLGTTTKTSFATSDFKVDAVKGKELRFATDKEVTVAEFKLVDKVSSFYICQNKACNKRMPSVQHGSAIFQCEACGILQRVKHAKKTLSTCICIELDGKDLWLSAFTDVMTTLMSKAGI